MLMKQEMTGWQWCQLDHMQIICLLQTDNHASTSSLNFLQVGCCSQCPTNMSKHWRQHNLLKNFFFYKIWMFQMHSFLQGLLLVVIISIFWQDLEYWFHLDICRNSNSDSHTSRQISQKASRNFLSNLVAQNNIQASHNLSTLVYRRTWRALCCICSVFFCIFTVIEYGKKLLEREIHLMAIM